MIVHPAETTIQAEISASQLYVGQSAQITASAADPNAKIIYISDDESVAQVDETGLVTAKKTGETKVRVRAVAGEKILAEACLSIHSARAYEKVNLSRIFSTNSTLQTQIADIGEEYDLLYRATTNSWEKPDRRSVTWESSDPSVFSVTEDGYGTALKTGDVTLTATLYNGTTETCTLACDYWSAKAYSLEELPICIHTGEEHQLRYMVPGVTSGLTPVFANSYDGDYYAKVNEKGVVTGVRQGETEIRISLTNQHGITLEGNRIPFVILDQWEPTGLTALPEAIHLTAGETVTALGAEQLLPAGSHLRLTDSYTVADPEVAEVIIEEAGDWEEYAESVSLRGLNAGTTIMTIEMEHLEPVVIPVIVTKADIYATVSDVPEAILKGESVTLHASEVQAPNAYQLIWASSDTQVLTVDQNGRISGISAGEAEVSLTVKDQKTGDAYVWTKTVQVYNKLSGFKVPETMTAARQGDYAYYPYLFVLQQADPNDSQDELIRRTRVLSETGLNWQLYKNEENEICIRTASYPQQTDRITLVTDNAGSTAEASFTAGFDDGYQTTISFRTSSEDLCVGEVKEVSSFLWDGKTKLPLVWSVEDPSIAQIENNSVVRGVAEGETTINAVATGADGREIKGSATITVSESEAVTRLTPEDEEATMAVDETKYMQVYVSPYGAKVWAETEPAGIVKVSVPESGSSRNVSLRGLKKGSATVTLHGTGEISCSFTVTVKQLPKSIRFEKEQLVLAVGESAAPKPIIFPADAEEMPLTWGESYSENDGVYQVEDSVITGLREGVGTLYVTVNNYMAHLTIVVYEPEAGEITALRPESKQLSMRVGDQRSNPIRDQNGGKISGSKLIWKSGNPGVVSVSSTGELTALKSGEATITVTTEDQKVSATFTVKVIQSTYAHALILPEGTATIEAEAFAGNLLIEEVICAENVSRIEERAFAGCSALKRVQIAGSACTIDETAFEGCGNDLVIVCPENSQTWRTCVAAGWKVEPLSE